MEGFIVVDDFCDKIDYVVKTAHASGFGKWLPNKGEVGSSVYDGMNYTGAHAPMVQSLMLHSGLIVVPNSLFFRNTNVGMEQAYIHSDREMGSHTCVAYLSQHDEPYGTAFFRHKPTGLDKMPSYQEMMEMGIFEQLKEDMVSRDKDKWELTGYVPGKYNRAVIFDAPLFHSRFPLEGIGDSPENGRLIWASHFYSLGEKGELY